MKNFIICLFFFLTAISHGYGQSEQREVGSFTRISMGIAGDLYIRQGNRISLELKGDKDDLEEIITKVSGATLEIKYQSSRWWSKHDRVTVYLTAPDIEGISLGGSGKVISEGPIRSDELDLRLSGSGKMIFETIVGELETSISGSGNMSLKGTAGRVELSISGSGNLDAEDLEISTCDVRISGSGRCKIWVKNEIDSRISGSGSVLYRGEPEKIYSDISGSGKLRKL